MPAGASTRNRTLSVNPAVLTFEATQLGLPRLLSPPVRKTLGCAQLQPTEKAQEVSVMPEALNLSAPGGDPAGASAQGLAYLAVMAPPLGLFIHTL